MGNKLESLKKHAFTRRNNQYEVSQSTTNLAESASVTPLTPVKDAEVKFHSISSEPSKECSQFYLACRNNKIKDVRRLLKTMSLDEIDQIEPNGSTALHVACYRGHYEIVQLLLEAGADRAIPNKYNYLPFDEALNDKIKELFFRVPNSNRLVSNTGAIEWDLIDDDVLENAVQERHQIKSFYDNVTGTTPINKMFEKIERNYIGKGLSHFDGIENIRRFFEKATKEQDPKWIIKAYTAETDFYKILNQEIACGATQYQSERRYLIALLWHHPSLNPLVFTGSSYRVLQINYNGLAKYQINCSLMTKSFLSSSIDRRIAELFLYQKESTQTQSVVQTRTKADGASIKSWVMCIYKIKHPRTALHIENSSQYANEGEVLIMPYTVFQVKSINQVQMSHLSKGESMTEIELEECQEYLNTSK